MNPRSTCSSHYHPFLLLTQDIAIHPLCESKTWEVSLTLLTSYVQSATKASPFSLHLLLSNSTANTPYHLHYHLWYLNHKPNQPGHSPGSGSVRASHRPEDTNLPPNLPWELPTVSSLFPLSSEAFRNLTGLAELSWVPSCPQRQSHRAGLSPRAHSRG